MHRGLVRLHFGVEGLPHGLAERARVSEVRLGRDVLVARATKEIEQRAHVGKRVAGRTVPLERQGDLALRAAVEVLAHEDHLLRRGEDPQLPGAAELEGELAEDLVTEPVEGADDRVVQPDRRVDVDALLHLRGGALGEGHREDLVRLRRERGDEMDDPCGEHVRLPRPGAGHDEERSGSVLDREALLGGERAEDVGFWLAERKAELLVHPRAGGSSERR